MIPASLVGRPPAALDAAAPRLPRRDLPALTSLRAFAAGYVVLHHAVNLALLHRDGPDADRDATLLLAWSTQGHIGVTFFFVLSGFILAWCYHGQFADQQATDDGARRRRRFWFARFARVWPLHAATFVVFALLALPAVSGASGLVTFAWTGAANLALVHAWLPIGGPDGLAETFNGPSWTLSCELAFYIAFPWIASLMARRMRLGVRGLVLVAGFAWAAVGLVVVATAGLEMGEWIARTFPGTRMGDFVIGVALGLAFVQRCQARVVRGEPQRTDAPTSYGTGVELLVVALAIISPLAWIAARGVLPDSLGISWFHLPVLAALVVVMAAEHGAVSRGVLARPVLVWLGEVSYALYLTHLLVLLTGYRVGVYDMVGAPAASGVLIVVAVVLAGLVHHLFERPARAWLVARRAASTGRRNA